MSTAADHLEVIDQLMKARRRESHARFKFWAEARERIGGVQSTMGRIREMQEHAGSRSVPDRAQTNTVEHACDVIQTALRVEQYVRAMPREWQTVIVGIYLDGKTQAALAAALHIERNRVVTRLQDAQDRLASEWEAQRIAQVMELGRDLTSACKDVGFVNAAQLRPAA